MATWILETSSKRLIGQLAPGVSNYTPESGQETIIITDNSDATWKQGGTYENSIYTPPANQPAQYSNSALDQLKLAASELVFALNRWQEGVNQVQNIYPSSSISKAHDWLSWAYYGAYRVCTSSSWTLMQRTTFCQQMSYGAADITNVFQFMNSQNANSLTTPTSAVVWVNVNSGNRVNLDQAIITTNTLASSWNTGTVTAEILYSNWWDSITE